MHLLKLLILSMALLALGACLGTDSEEDSNKGPSSREVRDSILVVLDSMDIDSAKVDQDILDSLVAEYGSFDFDVEELDDLFGEKLPQINPNDTIPKDSIPQDTIPQDSALIDPIEVVKSHTMDSAAVDSLKAMMIGNWVFTSAVLDPITSNTYTPDLELGYVTVIDTVGYDTLYNTLEYQITDNSGIKIITTVGDKYFPSVETREGVFDIEDGVILYDVKVGAWGLTHTYAIKIGVVSDASIELIPTQTGETESDTIVSEWAYSVVTVNNQIGTDQDGMLNITDTDISSYYVNNVDTTWVIQSSYSDLSGDQITIDEYNGQTAVDFTYQLLSDRIVLYDPSEAVVYEKSVVN